MKLAKIDITYFRCFESLSIPLHPDVNVLVGANGAGKTAALDAIAISLFHILSASSGGNLPKPDTQHASLQSSDIHIAPGSSSAETGRKDFVRFRTVITNLYKEITPKTLQTWLLPESNNPSDLVFYEEISYSPPYNFNYQLKGYERLQSYLELLWDALRTQSATEIPFPVVAYYRTTRALSGMPEMGDIFKSQMDRVSAFRNALDAGTNYQAMCQWFYLRENQELREKQYQNRNWEFEFSDLRAVRRALITMLENVEKVFFDGNPPTLKVAWANCVNTPKIVSLEQLSDGYRNLLAVVLDFARRLALAHPNWKNPLEAPGILVIDEIDLHLHPKWQQSVIPNLRKAFPNTQIIVTTHSPQILTTVRKEHILLLGSDHQFEHIPDDVGTYGAENSRVLAEIFGTHTRPQNIDTVSDLRTYLGLIEAGQHETEEAHVLKVKLESALGQNDPDLRRADLRIKQLKVMRKQ